MQMFVYLLDLQKDEKKIAEYLTAHKNVEPAISARALECGVKWARIVRFAEHLVEIIVTEDDFDAAHMSEVMASDPKCVAWEESMKAYQKRLPEASDEDWWVEAKQVVFDLRSQDNV